MDILTIAMGCGAVAILLIWAMRSRYRRAARALLAQAGEAAQTGRLQEAANLAAEALERTEDCDAKVLAARIHHLCGQDDAALQCLARERRTTALHLAAQVLLNRGETSQAAECLAEVPPAEMQPRHKLSQGALLAVVYAQLGDLTNAQAAIKTTSALLLRTTDRASRFDTHLALSQAYEAMNDPAAAFASASAGLHLALYPIERHQARVRLAQCLEACGKVESSKRWHEKVVNDGIESRYSLLSAAALAH